MRAMLTGGKRCRDSRNFSRVELGGLGGLILFSPNKGLVFWGRWGSGFRDRSEVVEEPQGAGGGEGVLGGCLPGPGRDPSLGGESGRRRYGSRGCCQGVQAPEGLVLRRKSLQGRGCAASPWADRRPGRRSGRTGPGSRVSRAPAAGPEGRPHTMAGLGRAGVTTRPALRPLSLGDTGSPSAGLLPPAPSSVRGWFTRGKGAPCRREPPPPHTHTLPGAPLGARTKTPEAWRAAASPPGPGPHCARLGAPSRARRNWGPRKG